MVPNFKTKSATFSQFSEDSLRSVFRLVQTVCHRVIERFPFFILVFSISARPCTVSICRCARRYRQRRNLHRDIEYRLRNSSHCNAMSSLRLQNRSHINFHVGSNYCYITGHHLDSANELLTLSYYLKNRAKNFQGI